MTEFSFRVYLAVTQIPAGKVSTYKAVARAAGNEGASRAVGRALSVNPYAPWVPCHRVVSSSGKIGGFFGSTLPVDVQRKIDLLRSEGVRMADPAKFSKSELAAQVFDAFVGLPLVALKVDVGRRIEELKNAEMKVEEPHSLLRRDESTWLGVGGQNTSRIR